MPVWFNMLDAVSEDVGTGEVKEYRETRQCSIFEAQEAAKANALYSRLSDMRYRQGKFEDASNYQVVDELLDMLMAATKFNQ